MAQDRSALHDLLEVLRAAEGGQLLPDFVPVLGYADDVVIVALALRWVVRRAGAELLTRHWPGTPEGLAAVQRLSGLPT